MPVGITCDCIHVNLKLSLVGLHAMSEGGVVGLAKADAAGGPEGSHPPVADPVGRGSSDS